MVDAISTALSGFRASEQRIAVAADNIANVNTTNFRAQEVTQASQPTGGVATQVVDRNPATITVRTPEGNTEEKPNVSLDAELVRTQAATYDARANLQVIKAAREISKSLIDIQA
jgi:flagellar basal body rod protein FlgG